jgi:hypothetical protein
VLPSFCCFCRCLLPLLLFCCVSASTRWCVAATVAILPLFPVSLLLLVCKQLGPIEIVCCNCCLFAVSVVLSLLYSTRCLHHLSFLIFACLVHFCSPLLSSFSDGDPEPQVQPHQVGRDVRHLEQHRAHLQERPQDAGSRKGTHTHTCTHKHTQTHAHTHTEAGVRHVEQHGAHLQERPQDAGSRKGTQTHAENTHTHTEAQRHTQRRIKV